MKTVKVKIGEIIYELECREYLGMYQCVKGVWLGTIFRKDEVL